MSCESESAQSLRSVGGRVTSQRVEIAATLRHLGEHRTAEEIFDAVTQRALHAGISRPTVYRTLNTLRELGLVAKVDSTQPRGSYAWVNEHAPHHHLVCVRCGAELPLDRTLLESLRGAIEAETDFEAHLGHLTIPGRCRACRAAP